MDRTPLGSPRAGAWGELALAPERGFLRWDGGPSPSLRDTSPRRGARQEEGRDIQDPVPAEQGRSSRNSAVALYLILVESSIPFVLKYFEYLGKR